MRRKQSSIPTQVSHREVELRSRIRADLESLGVSRAFSSPVAERLVATRPVPGSEVYLAALHGAATAYGVYREDCVALEDSSRDIDEIQRLMHGFAGELRKLEEGLRIVNAYVLRMHDRATRDRGGTLH
jgi:hypothetical protein